MQIYPNGMGGDGNCATSIKMPETVSKMFSSPEKKPKNEISFSKLRFLPIGIISCTDLLFYNQKKGTATKLHATESTIEMEQGTQKQYSAVFSRILNK